LSLYYPLDNLHYSFINLNMIELINMGSSVNYPDREIDDTYTNSNGLGDWVFMHFTTPFCVKTPEGLIECSSGEILINSPDYPQWHRGVGTCFKNDWLIFNGEGISSLFKELHIPINFPFKNIKMEKVISLFNDIQREKIMTDKFWKEKVDLLIKGLFLEIARGFENENDLYYTEREKDLLPKFQDIRVLVKQSPDKKWKVEEMAELVPLSPNRFAVLYNKFFQKTPLSDLLDTRLTLAKALLLNHTAKIEVIAEQCGFSSIHYFWRMFKKRYGISPSEYRKTKS